jgi:tetratricopeptide (TPR) repeat protein
MKRISVLLLLLLIIGLGTGFTVQAQVPLDSFSIGQLGVSYPAGWQAQDSPDGGIFVANTTSAMRLMVNNAGRLTDNEVAIMILPPRFLSEIGVSATAEPRIALNSVLSALGITGDVQTYPLGGYDGVMAEVRSVVIPNGFARLYAFTHPGGGTVLGVVQINQTSSLRAESEFTLASVILNGVGGAAFPSAAPTLTVLGSGALAQGELTASLNEQAWRVSLTAGDVVTIEMVAEDFSFDPYLYLYRANDFPAGRPIAENDDSRDSALGSLNSRIDSFAITQTGDYVILASSFARRGVGRYELTISGSGSYTLLPLLGFTAEPTAVSTVDVTEFLESAITLVQGGQYQSAILALNAILIDAPDNATAYLYRGLSHYYESNLEAALADYDQAMRLGFENPAWNHSLRGLAYFELGRYGEAMADYDEAIRLDPNYVGARRNRAYLNSSVLGDWEAVADDYTVIVELVPDNADYRNELAWALVQLGRFSEALPHADEALRLDSELGYAWDTRGWVYLGLGVYPQAQLDFEQAIELGEIYGYYGLGQLYADAGSPARAIENLRTYLSLAGENAASGAIALLAQLEGSPGGELRQWAIEATGTSQYGTTRWSFQQALGEPNTENCGDIPTAWASATSTGSDILALEFAEAVIPSQVNIYQTYNPGSIIRVELGNTETSQIIAIPDSADPPGNTPCPGVFTLDVSGITSPVNAVIIYLDQTIGRGWNEIDAVELVGSAPGGGASGGAVISPAALANADAIVTGQLTQTVTEQLWRTNLAAGDVITLWMIADDGDALDPLIRFYSLADYRAGAAPLATNDDARDESLGSIYDSRLADFTIPQSGDYVIVATRFRGTGTYRLAIQSRGSAALEPLTP